MEHLMEPHGLEVREDAQDELDALGELVEAVGSTDGAGDGARG